MKILDWPEWSFAISLFANASVSAFVIAFGVSGIYIAKTRWAFLSPASRAGMLALNLLGWYIIVRIGYWAPTMWFSDVGAADRYHPGWIDWRWISYAPASVLGLAAMSALAVSILRWRWKTLAGVLAVCIAIGLAVGLSWIMSEHGYWFDRTAVIEAHDRFFGFER